MRPELVLASRSPRRREILRRLGLAFSVQPGEVDEAGLTGKDPAELVERLALSKALDVAGTKERALVIGADTIVVLDGEVLGKPADSREAITMLERLQGRKHQVYSGLAVVEVQGGSPLRKAVGHRVTEVTMRPVDREEIEWYVGTGEPLDKAGAYGIQGLGVLLVDRIEGCYTNVVGMSVPLLLQLTKRLGYALVRDFRLPDDEA
ncbi:MAG: Maf family protein [Planifilum fulgidum]